MKQRILGRSGIHVSELGLGARWLITDNKSEAEIQANWDTLKTALDEGINHIDTAAGYGDSEAVVGEALKGHPAEVTISTKTWTADEAKIRQSLEKSLTLLNREFVDVYLIHNSEATFDALPIYQKLKEEGLVKAIGACGWHGDEDLIKQVIEDGRADILQIACTIVHRGMLEKGVVRMAAERELGIQVMGPLEKGRLSGYKEVVEPLNEFGIFTLEQAALKFLIDHIPNGLPIPGTAKPERINDFISVTDKEPIPEESWHLVLERLAGVPELQEIP